VTAPLVVLALLAAADDWKRVDTIDGIAIDSRPVKGSHVVELKLTASASAPVDRLCDEAFGPGKFDPEEPDLKSRKVLEESADSRVTYDQINPPLVSQRDFAVRATRVRLEGGVCEMRFAAANELAPKSPPGFVRIEKVSGYWRFEPTAEGKSRITYVVHADPAGAIPPFLIEGTRRAFAVRWVKLISARAARPLADAGT
jgi:START domain